MSVDSEYRYWSLINDAYNNDFGILYKANDNELVDFLKDDVATHLTQSEIDEFGFKDIKSMINSNEIDNSESKEPNYHRRIVIQDIASNLNGLIDGRVENTICIENLYKTAENNLDLEDKLALRWNLPEIEEVPIEFEDAFKQSGLTYEVYYVDKNKVIGAIAIPDMSDEGILTFEFDGADLKTFSPSLLSAICGFNSAEWAKNRIDNIMEEDIFLSPEDRAEEPTVEDMRAILDTADRITESLDILSDALKELENKKEDICI